MAAFVAGSNAKSWVTSPVNTSPNVGYRSRAPRAAALAADGIAARLAGQAVRKFVYVPGQVVNLVVG